MTLLDHAAPRPAGRPGSATAARRARARLADEGLVAAYLHEISTRRRRRVGTTARAAARGVTARRLDAARAGCTAAA
jgi:hypothetical protein